MSHIRAGRGPALLECRAYRWRGHHGGGDDSASGYRPGAEVAHWQTHCPVEGFAARLQAAGWLDAPSRDRLEEQLAAEIAAAFEFALASPEPDVSEVLDHVYAP